MYALIGIIIGFLINRLILAPLRAKKIREELVRDGLIPWDKANELLKNKSLITNKKEDKK